MITILFVDDEEVIRSVVAHSLGIPGELEVETAPSAETAIEMMKGTIYDAIVADYDMPGGMDGITFLTHLRNDGNQIPFIIFTGKGQEEVAINAINHGADFYIQKGESPRAQFADLVQKIGQAVQRRRTENALKESERNYRNLLESLPDLILTTGRDGIVSSLNNPGAFALEVQSDRVLNKPWTVILESGRAAEAQEAFLAMMESGSPMADFPASLAPVQPGREVIPVAVYGTVIRNGAGDATGARMIVRAVAGGGNAPGRFRIAEERFLTLLSLLPLAVIIIDPEGRVRQWNVGAAHQFGWTADEAIGSIIPLVPPDMKTEFYKVVSWCMQGEKLRNIAIHAKRCNGSLVRVMLHAAPLHDGTGAISEILLVVTPAE